CRRRWCTASAATRRGSYASSARGPAPGAPRSPDDPRDERGNFRVRCASEPVDVRRIDRYGGAAMLGLFLPRCASTSACTRRARGLAVAVAVAALGSSLAAGPAAAQWLGYASAGVPRKADGAVNMTAPAPRLADGKPDFSGIWATAT